MMPSWPDGASGSSSASASTSQSPCARYHPYARKRHPGENVLRLLAWREVAPTVKRPLRRLWGEAATWSVSCSGYQREVTDAKMALVTWLEAESLSHSTAKYCPLQPAPRSTIAAAFSPDGNTLASTHGDHTVKIICCRTGFCLKVLSGHRRTPWVVRFHPGSSEVLASGSLDNEVRLWDANTAECVGSRDFHRPIASLAFHAQGDLLAVASGHKLYIWQYTKEGEAASPIIVLRTRRSLRAVHFHPHAAPLLLTAEVNDLDSPDCPMTLATSRGYLHYPAPAIHFTTATSAQQSNPQFPISQPFVSFPVWFWPGLANGSNDTQTDVALGENSAAPADRHDDAEDGSNGAIELERDSSLQLHTTEFSSAAPMDLSPRPTHVDSSAASTSGENKCEVPETELPNSLSVQDFGAEQTREGLALAGDPGRSSPTVVGAPWDVGEPPMYPVSSRTTNGSSSRGPVIPVARRQVDSGGSGPGPGIWPITAFSNLNSASMTGGPSGPHFVPSADYSTWDLPVLHGWVQGQQAGLAQPQSFSTVAGLQSGLSGGMTPQNEGRASQPHHSQQQNAPATVASAALAALATAARIGAGNSHIGPGVRQIGNPSPGRGIQFPLSTVDPAGAAQAALADIPCTVKLRIWPHDIRRPSALLDPETCRLTIPHAVLCSEMGAHFSPCGRFLAACVACVLPPPESEMQGQGQRNMNGSPGGGNTVHSPTQHPISSQQVIYELRVYSLEEATFGQVLASRAVRAAHCLTSIQFSPTSGHILLAYGRRHNSLLRSLVVDGSRTIPIYTILEVYRVSDMELVRVLPSAEDEVNVACFHPMVGGGLVYGTKEGKLRILRHDRTPRHLKPRRVHELEDELLEQAETADPLSFGMLPDIE
ncbi:activating molecule in BECN1-regulated autophagy protein 1 [Marchantia polymorpha subsp. ruderalis]